MPNDALLVSSVAAPVRAQVLQNLREAILSRRFLPGQRLIERELCELTGVSRTPIREALRHLESEGLVVMVPNRGPMVAEITTQEAAEIYDVRSALEALAARRFAERATDDEMTRLEERVEAYARGVDDGRSVADLLERKSDFYAELFAGARIQLIPQMLQSLHARVLFLRATSLGTPGRSRETVDELRAIVQAAKRRDPGAAARAAHLHVVRAAEVALTAMQAQDADGTPAG